MKNRRNVFDKLNTLLFGKDLRVTQGGPYTIVRKYDFSSYYPKNYYIHIILVERKLLLGLSDVCIGSLIYVVLDFLFILI